MTVIVMLLLGFVVGWFSRSAFDAIWAVRLERRTDVFGLARAQALSDIRSRSRRAEEQMRRVAYRGRS